MELFNKSGALISSVLVMVGSLIACQAKEGAVPPAPVIEAVAQRLGAHGGAAAERRLREWAEQGSIVAKRELGMLYQNKAPRRGEAMRLFEEAARAGDAESAFQLAEMYHHTANGSSHEPDKAWPLYAQAAEHRHPKAVLRLASLAQGGSEEAARWLAVAGHLK
ncbi:sel1 repeat family protein [Pseudoduganella umbonata]|uniref:TPR repeat protein n=1 Tax=Pseudoduganella umbonata TaxID=864828 RepID=A0A7W5E6Z4_9BURK|nr:sel1 repeat family protein [Pseudoduganella umbonata]MBB3219726.1 TPR repeat protein [Pseudoduganella umbonata]